MTKISFWVLILLAVNGQAALYDAYEINTVTQSPQTQELSQNYIHNYFTTAKPESVIDQLMKANISPLEREYILYQLLTEISQHPPQHFHQPFVDLMKSYSTEAYIMADEGPHPNAIFNLVGKAHGIENIWLAYRTEQNFNQLFNENLPQAMTAIGNIIAANTAQRRPQWLGVKNSIAAMSPEQLTDLSEHLRTRIKINAGLDQLISHVGLQTANLDLIDKALNSNQQAVREFTLRHLNDFIQPATAKQILLENAAASADAKFSTSLLAQYTNDNDVQDFLLGELKNKQTANQAAFALSQSTDNSLPERLKRQFFKSPTSSEKNHILLALKLNKSDVAQLALEDIQRQLPTESAANQWLKSFTGGEQ